MEEKMIEKIAATMERIRQQYPQTRNDVHCLEQAFNQYFQQQAKAKEFNRSFDDWDEGLADVLKKVKIIIKNAIKQVKSKQFENLYVEYKSLVNPILHNQHNGHQRPYHAMNTYSAHMKFNLLQELKRETEERKNAEDNLESLYAGMKETLLRKDAMIKQLEQKLKDANNAMEAQSINHYVPRP